MTGFKNILVIRFSAMGDVAMTAPIIKALAQQHPGLKITYASRPEFAEFFSGIPNLTYFPVDLNAGYKGLQGIFKLFKTLKDLENFDALADLHDNLRSKIIRKLFGLSGLTCAFIDKGRHEKKLLTRFPGKVLKQLKSTPERYADVFRELGFSLNLDHQLIKKPRPLTNELLTLTGEKNNRWIGIAPFAKHKGKIYPLDKTEEVIKLLDKKGVKIFLFGGSVLEEEICQQWQQKYTAVISTIRRLTMTDELVLISQLDGMMSMDSAGMHLASLEGVPVVSVWGATHHFAGFLGYGQSANNIVADDIECRPCSVYGDKPCFRKDYACLYRVEPQTIVDRLNQFIT
jgi:ADP-heptose:LPS heptosyltransferase